ncbi:C40 family peptidase [Kitasatospora azatica]|uniref:C40 family peptidase n=1 Tax=Kitasatospora azatica TaxID=58347 RepID=UPI00069002A3|nr:C40 family peptidase [Kitasatospora azatica]
MMPDLNSADQPQQLSSAQAPACRPGRLRHRLGLAAAIVAGTGSIVLGAGLAQAAPTAAQPGLVVADDPVQSEEATEQATEDTRANEDSQTTEDAQATDDSQATDDTSDSDTYGSDDQSGEDSDYASADETASSDDAAASDDADSDDQDSPDTSAGGLHQGWDGSVYWFRNSSGEWRYTAHRDIYLNRIGSGGTATSSSPSSSGAEAPATARGDVETAVQFALAQIGKPFVMGGNGPDSYDCSGLIQQSFRRAGTSLPRVANDQYQATTPVSAGQLRRGDLIFWSPDGSARGIQHAAIYLGNNKYVEAAHPGTTVRISTLNRGYWPTQMGRP